MKRSRRLTVAGEEFGSAEASDEELVRVARAGDSDALAELVGRYRGCTRAKGRSYFLAGAEPEDIFQEGMIGLYKAVRDFDEERAVSFRAFAELCIGRQIITAVKAATRHKHAPLNGYLSLHQPLGVGDDGDCCLADVLATSELSDPAEIVICAERLRALQEHVQTALSELETEVLRLYLSGKTYGEIAAMMSRHVKSIDNAIQRIKRKLDWHLRERELAETG